MTATAKRETEQTSTEYRELAPTPLDFEGFDDLFDDIAEIINENFILEVEESRNLGK